MLKEKNETIKQMNQNTGGFVISDYKVFYSPQKPQSADLYVAVW